MKRILQLVILVFLQYSVFAQNMDWVTGVDMDPYHENLFHFNDPTGTIIDSDGAIWSSFKHGGSNGYITRYYNYIYTYYTADSLNFPATDVRNLCQENGIIYAATDSGVVKFDGTNWNIYLNTDNGLHTNHVGGMDIKNNKIYARTDTTVNIYDINSNSFTYISLPTSYDVWLNSSVRRAVYIDDNENLYIGDTNAVYLINNDTITSTYNTNTYSDYIIDIKKTSSGQLYALSNYKVYKLIGNELIDLEGILNPLVSGIGFISTPNNILVDNDTIYLTGEYLIKITVNNDYKIYYFPQIGYTYPIIDPYMYHFTGYIFKNLNNNICIKNKSDHYNIFDLALYTNIDALTKDNSKHLDINNISATYSQNCQLFNFLGKAGYEVPKGSGKHSNYTSSLWVSAEDEYSLIYTAAQQFSSDGFDYYPGPLNEDGETDSTESYRYNKVWKINRLDIDEMKYRYEYNLLTQPGYQIPEDILTWPANGDVSQGYSENLAPYFDANGDNIYDIFAGDYPLIKGDQELFSIFNDNTAEHSDSKGVPLKLEIHNSFYAYSCPDATDSTSEINYTTFLHYRIINKSDKTYLNTHIGIFSDADIGEPSNDLVGSNVDLKSFYFYNKGDDGDGTLSTYGENPPAISYTFLKGVDADNADNKDNNNNGLIDEANETCDFNHFLYYDRTLGTQQSDANEPIDYFYYIRSIWKDGSHLKYGGNGYGNTTDTIAEFSYPGNSDSNNYGTHGIDPGFPWYNTQKGDKRGIGSMGPFTFEPGEVIEFEIAIVWSRDTTDLVDSNNVQKLFRDIENVRYWYDNDINLSCLEFDSAQIGISEVENIININIYPNPVENNLNIEFSDYKDAYYKIMDINGKVLEERYFINEMTRIDTKDYSKGVYLISIYKDKSVISKKFIK